MAISPINIVRALGWRSFFKLLLRFPSFVKLFTRLMKDSRVSVSPKLLALGILAYVVLPTDFLPDFLIGIGQIDDLMVIVTGLKLFLKLCPPDVVQEHLQSISAGR